MIFIITNISGLWYTNPSEKYEFVSWDDEITLKFPIYMEKDKNMFQSPPSRYYSSLLHQGLPASFRPSTFPGTPWWQHCRRWRSAAGAECPNVAPAAKPSHALPRVRWSAMIHESREQKKWYGGWMVAKSCTSFIPLFIGFNKKKWYIWWLQNPAPVDKCFIPLFIGFQPYKVVQDFATIHSIICW